MRVRATIPHVHRKAVKCLDVGRRKWLQRWQCEGTPLPTAAGVVVACRGPLCVAHVPELAQRTGLRGVHTCVVVVAESIRRVLDGSAPVLVYAV